MSENVEKVERERVDRFRVEDDGYHHGGERESMREYADRMLREVDDCCPSCRGEDGQHKMSCIYRPTHKGERLSMSREDRR